MSLAFFVSFHQESVRNISWPQKANETLWYLWWSLSRHIRNLLVHLTVPRPLFIPCKRWPVMMLPTQDRKQQAPSKSLFNELSSSFEVQLKLFANLERWSRWNMAYQKKHRQKLVKTRTTKANRVFYACFSETKLFVAAARLTGKHIF